jgi:outer membrane immunogenic protein
MRRLVLSGIALGLLTAAPAMAADIRAPMLKAPPMAPVFNWTGLYIGGHAGCGWADSPAVTAFNTSDGGGDFVHNTENATGCFSGGQIGADYQVGGGFVFGILGDISFGKISSFNQSLEDARTEATGWESKMTSMATVRGRIGYAISGGLPVVGGLGWMPYVTGGWAWARNKVSAQGDAGTFTSDTQSLSGWTIGGGLEYAITQSLTWKAEYLYTRYNSASYAVTLDDDGIVPGITLGRTNLSTFRTGLNWRFGGGRF